MECQPKNKRSFFHSIRFARPRHKLVLSREGAAGVWWLFGTRAWTKISQVERRGFLPSRRKPESSGVPVEAVRIISGSSRCSSEISLGVDLWIVSIFPAEVDIKWSTKCNGVLGVGPWESLFSWICALWASSLQSNTCFLWWACAILRFGIPTWLPMSNVLLHFGHFVWSHLSR